MSDTLEECGKMLEELCQTMIQVLDGLKAKGMISQAEYNEHIEKKRRYLEMKNNQNNS